jgi:hypothetical protein
MAVDANARLEATVRFLRLLTENQEAMEDVCAVCAAGSPFIEELAQVVDRFQRKLAEPLDEERLSAAIADIRAAIPPE